jgi:hypothetical protein
MNEDAKERAKEKASAAVASILLQSEFVKKGGAPAASRPQSKWKMRGAI